MATITIKFVQPTAPVEGSVASICALFNPNNAYIDMDVYEGTVYDTNVDGWGEWEGLAAYLSQITNAPNALILFKAAYRDGEVSFEEADPKQVEYYKELGKALGEFGFEVSDGSESSETSEPDDEEDA